MDADSKREAALFQAAAHLSGAERAAFLQAVCRDEPALRQRLEERFSTPATMQGGLTETAPDAKATLKVDVRDDPPDKAIGASIGRYKILEMIGEGGCGAVYVAEQTEPVRRRVALKVIKLGMDTKAVVARFEAERQALALMDHPNIAKVLDAGATETGRPYFVMELVRGIRITDYCDQSNLATKERLDLFIKVCQAIQHAHQKGIIHRDIKPSNILVTLHDGVPVPKVIDFGIAKATEGRLTDATVYTQLHQFIGTPAYMSPEQAEMSGLDIDTRSDIYSLGVLLYELLAGSTPFDPKELMASGLDAMRKTIREQEPVRPSTRLATLGADQLTTTARRRSADTSKLLHQLKGDLDWIVMKCLEKDRTRRYETANGLAADLKRHLNHEPVVARPPSTAYRLQKAWRRNKLVFSAGTAVVLALIFGLGMAAVGWRQALAERNAAVTARAGEETQRRQAQAAQASETDLRRRAQDQELIARRRAYAADMNLVQQALAMNNLGRAQMLLHGQKPEPGQADLRGWEWRYLWSQTRADEHQIFFSGTHELARLSFSGDGRLLVREVEGEIVVSDVASRQVVFTQSASSHAEFAHQNSLLAFARNEPKGEVEVVLWDFSTQLAIRKLPFSGSRVEWILFTPDDQRLLTVSVPPNSRREDGAMLELAAWDVATGTNLWRRPLASDQTGDGRHYAVSPDGMAIAATEWRHLQVFDVSDGRKRFAVEATRQTVLALTFSPDSSMVLSGAGYTDPIIRLWDAHDGKPLGSLEGHRSWVSDLVFTPDGQRLISASGDQTIRLWDWSTRKPAGMLRGHLSEVQGLAMSPKGRTLASACKDGSVYLWDLDRLTAPPAHQTLPVSVANAVFAPDSRSLVAAESGGGITQFDLQSLRRTRQWDVIRTTTAAQPNPGPQRYAFKTISADAAQVALFGATGKLCILDLASGAERTNLLGDYDTFDDCWWADNGKLFVTATMDMAHNAVHARLWETRTWHSAATLDFNTRERRGVQPSPTHGFCFNQNGQNLLLWNLSKPAELPRKFPGGLGREEFWGAEISPDGQTLAAAYGDGYVRLWNVQDQRPIKTLRGYLLGVHSIAFSPDGQRLAAGSNGLEAIKLWDTQSWQELLTLSGEGNIFRRAAFSPDGQILMAINIDGLAYLWYAPSWEKIAAAEAKEKAEKEQP